MRWTVIAGRSKDYRDWAGRERVVLGNSLADASCESRLTSDLYYPTMVAGGRTIRARGVWVAILVAGLVIVPSLYVLSTGPVLGLFARGYLSVETMNAVDRIYWPLDFVCDNMAPLARALDSYRQLWLPVGPVALPPSTVPPIRTGDSPPELPVIAPPVN